MMYLGDYAEDAMLDFKWHSSDSSGASITRATDGTISVYKANGDTQSVEGVTDTEDFDSLTGVHHCRIDLSAHAFYATGNDYQVVLSAATIDGQVVNAVLATFSIENRYMRGTNSANTTTPPTAIQNRQEMDSNSTQLGAIVSDTNELQTDDIPGTLVTIDALIDAIKAVTDNLSASAGVLITGTAEAGTLSTTAMTTDLSESTNDHYNGRVIIWTSGVLTGQATAITDYQGSDGMLTYTATTEAPGEGDTFVIV